MITIKNKIRFFLGLSLFVKIDKYNVNNFIQNFEFIINKLYMKRFILDPTYKKNSVKSYKKHKFNLKKKFSNQNR